MLSKYCLQFITSDNNFQAQKFMPLTVSADLRNITLRGELVEEARINPVGLIGSCLLY